MSPPNHDDRPPCPKPADLRAEIARYDAEATVERWDGPRYRMTYRRLGQGPPLVVVRGISGSYQGFALLLNRLAERFSTVLYDYPGEVPDDGARLEAIGHEDLADDVAGLLDHLGLGRAFPLGVSFGSTVALRALHRHARRFPKAVLQGGFAHRRFTRAERLALALGRHVPGTVRSLPMHRQVTTWNNRAEFPAVIADRWPLFLEHSEATRIAGLAHRVTLLSRLDLRPILPEIRAEILDVQGKEDRIVPFRFIEQLRGGLPDFRAAIVPVAGHQLHYTHAEWFARIITESLLGCDASDCGARAAHPDPGATARR